MDAVPAEQLKQWAAEWFEQETGRKPEPALLARTVWEWKNVQDGNDLARVMAELSAKHPGRKDANAATPRLPVMPDLTQALNLAACDSRAVIVLVHPEEGAPELERTLTRLAFEPGLVGRAHFARLDAEEWAEARRVAQILDGTLASGVMLVAPDPWGLEGRVWVELEADAGVDELRTGLRAGLDRFRTEWRKQDRTSHLRTALDRGLTWTEYDADADAVKPIGEGSSKLGRRITYH